MSWTLSEFTGYILVLVPVGRLVSKCDWEHGDSVTWWRCSSQCCYASIPLDDWGAAGRCQKISVARTRKHKWMHACTHTHIPYVHTAHAHFPRTGASTLSAEYQRKLLSRTVPLCPAFRILPFCHFSHSFRLRCLIAVLTGLARHVGTEGKCVVGS